MKISTAEDTREAIEETLPCTELEESDPFADVEEDKHEFEENELILEDC